MVLITKVTGANLNQLITGGAHIEGLVLWHKAAKKWRYLYRSHHASWIFFCQQIQVKSGSPVPSYPAQSLMGSPKTAAHDLQQDMSSSIRSESSPSQQWWRASTVCRHGNARVGPGMILMDQGRLQGIRQIPTKLSLVVLLSFPLCFFVSFFLVCPPCKCQVNVWRGGKYMVSLFHFIRVRGGSFLEFSKSGPYAHWCSMYDLCICIPRISQI